MSLNSLQDSMSRRAASMAAMAKRATNPEEIQAIQQSLVTGVQNGSIQPYIGIPLIQDLTKKLTEAKASMAQNVAGAGMPQPPAGGPPIAQQVMQQAAQADQPQGIEALPSNLPQSYAGGGIVAFEEGGQVERYQSGGTPAGRFFSGIGQSFSEADEAAKLRNQLQMKYGPASALPGLFMTQTDEERQTAKDVAAALPNLTLDQLKQLNEQGPSGLSFVNPALAASQGIPTPAQQGAYPGGSIPPNIRNVSRAAPAAPAAGGPQTSVNASMSMKETAFPGLTDLDAITKRLPADTKAATEDAVTKTQKIYEDMDKPGFEAREGRLGKREAEQEKNSAVGRALNLISLGFGVAGSKERSLAGALNKEGREGIQSLIQGEAANRAAKDKLEDYRDNLEQQKVAAKKGNYQAAQAAGERAADNLYKYTTLNLNAAQAGNTQAIQRYEAEGNQAFRKASVEQGIAGIKLKERELAQTGAYQQGSLKLGQEKLSVLKSQIAAGNERAKATLMQAENKIASTWQSSPDYQKAQAQSKNMPPIEAQRYMQQAFIQYKGNMLPSLLATEGSGGVPYYGDIYKATE